MSLLQGGTVLAADTETTGMSPADGNQFARGAAGFNRGAGRSRQRFQPDHNARIVHVLAHGRILRIVQLDFAGNRSGRKIRCRS